MAASGTSVMTIPLLSLLQHGEQPQVVGVAELELIFIDPVSQV